MNTDAQALLRVNSDKKVLIGKKTSRGLGAGSNPDVGEAAAEESKEEIKNLTQQNTTNINVGVLGHIDSGKTSLCRVLSKVSVIIDISKGHFDC